MNVMELNNSEEIKNEVNFDTFYTEVKEIEKRDSVLTSDQQINRLLRPGSTYFNLNPYEVLQIEPETTLEEAKKKYKRLSILVHPDKNQNNVDRALNAFEIVNKAWKVIENEETRKKCLAIIDEAKERTDHMIREKKKKLKKENQDIMVEEDDPQKYKRAVYVLTMKLFAEAEQRRRNLEVRSMEERKRQREQEIVEEEKTARDREWQKHFEESRQNRVDSWKQFQANTSEKKTKKLKTFKPPKHKAESR